MNTGGPAARRRQRDKRVGAYVAMRVRSLRLAQAMTQEELAIILGVKRESMSRYESGERTITIALLLDIAAALAQPVTTFLPAGAQEEALLAQIVEALRARPDLIPSVQDLLTVMREEPG
jgi:transcriptional regulator with XRE-family HTH domain